MYRMKMEAASEAGDLDAVKAAYRQAQRVAESYGFDEEVQPETQALSRSSPAVDGPAAVRTHHTRSAEVIARTPGSRTVLRPSPPSERPRTAEASSLVVAPRSPRL